MVAFGVVVRQCKKSKEKIDKGAPRVGIVREVDGHEMTAWNKLECFTLPRKNPPTMDDFTVDPAVAQVWHTLAHTRASHLQRKWRK